MRVNFISIINSHVTPSAGHEVPPLRTGYEKSMADRLQPPYAYTAKETGQVTKVDKEHIHLKFDSGEELGIELGRYMGDVAGETFAHDVVPNFQEGERFEPGQAIVYNTGFFEPDPLAPKEIILKTGMLCKTAVFERTHTFEDASMISERVAEALKIPKIETRDIWVDFTQQIHNLVEEGQSVDPETILCQIEDPVNEGEDTGKLDPETVEFLQLMSTKAPWSKYKGKIDQIEIVYNGNIDEMSGTLAEIVKVADRQRMRRAKKTGKTPLPGKVDENMRMEGQSVSPGTVVIRVYIADELKAGVGDKGVVGHQLKTVFSHVMTGINETEQGEPIDVGFGYAAIAKRIVTSPEVMGTANTLLAKMSKMVARRYFGEE